MSSQLQREMRKLQREVEKSEVEAKWTERKLKSPIRKAHVLGTSLGGFVAHDLALTRPHLVDGLVLVCTSYGARESERMSLRTIGRMFGWRSFSGRDATRRGLATATSHAYRAEHPEEFEDLIRWRLATSPSFSGYYEQALAGARFDSSRDVVHITAPTLVIHGTDDRYVPVGNAAARACAIPGSRLVVLRDTGRLVFIERAWEVNREVASSEPVKKGFLWEAVYASAPFNSPRRAA